MDLIAFDALDGHDLRLRTSSVPVSLPRLHAHVVAILAAYRSSCS